MIFIVVAFLLAGWSGGLEAVNKGIFDSAKSGVSIAIGLVGAMAFFLGLMKAAERAGLMATLARVISPVMRLVFPGVPAGHPAMSAMIMNIAANMLGLANAATPFGIKAMEQLDTLNPHKGRATDAMCTFLAINTAGLALLPSGVATLRASVGSQDPFGIFLPTLMASGAATIIGITVALSVSKLLRPKAPDAPVQGAVTENPGSAAAADGGADESGDGADQTAIEPPAFKPLRVALAVLYAVTFVALIVRDVVTQSPEGLAEGVRIAMVWALPAIVSFLVVYPWTRGVNVYDAVVEGAKEGFNVALRIIPFLVAILVAVGMLRNSGAIGSLSDLLAPLTAFIGMPPEAFPMAILRPLSGSGAYAIAAEIMQEHGADSLIGYMVSTYQGSTETTFYVLAVYFGAIRVQDPRWALIPCLAADVAGILTATVVVTWLFG
ncbi:hypothetical protein ABI59_15985 [Acidobacteria bacterium Mor1]|nr:hypothetical protein ABI59_15985 [Acidobacteria bacterium Mor1]